MTTCDSKVLVNDEESKSFSETIQSLKRTKYAALPLLCIIYFFVMVNYEGPAALQTIIMSDLSYSASKFSFLMSASCWPSAFSFLGGVLADRYVGLNRGFLILVAVFSLGSLFYGIGMYTMHFPTLIAGRIISGWGGEAVGALVSCYIVLWFSDGGMNTAFAIQSSLTLLEPAVIYQVATPLYSSLTRDDHSLENRQRALGHVSAILMSTSVPLAIFAIVVIMLHGRSMELDEFHQSPSPVDKSSSSVLDKLRLPLTFWILSLIATSVQTSSYTFISMSQDFYVNYYRLGLNEVNDIVSCSSFISVIGVPLIGLVVDRTGKNLYYMIFSILLALIAHPAMLITSIYPFIPAILLSLSSCLFLGSYYKLIGQSVSEHQIGTAYGIAYSLVNVGCGGGFTSVGFITDYLGMESRIFFFLILSIVALILNLFLFFLDAKKDVEITSEQNIRLPHCLI